MNEQIQNFFNSNLGKIFVLALLYIFIGRLGLLLALPPGYATIVWPPSGIAVGMLFVHGWRLWPGIFIGSFILNLYIAKTLSSTDGIIISQVITAAIIALGSSVQALGAFLLVRRYIKFPLSFYFLKEIWLFFLIVGPLSCLIASSVGTTALYFLANLPAEQIYNNWLAWWGGDVLGVLFFMPLVGLLPGSRYKIKWRNKTLVSLPITVMLMLIIPLFLTFYTWKITCEYTYQNNFVEFELLAQESEKALEARLSSYDHALLGGVGFFKGSDFVSREEWRSYVETVKIEEHFPGINGIGYIKELKAEEVPEFLEKVRQDNAPEFAIYPETIGRPYYVVTYIEPENKNMQSIGLNIGFEANRLEAANLSRDTGKSAITKRIVLVQDEEKSPGFLLFYPMYKKSPQLNTVEERRAAFEGWIYAPFIGKSFMRDLTGAQGKDFHITIYDGLEKKAGNIIYSSSNSLTLRNPKFSTSRKISTRQQEWLVVWESTQAFEQRNYDNNSLFILVGGLIFTAMLGMFLMLDIIERSKNIEHDVGRRMYLYPAIIFIFVSSVSYLFFTAIKQQELDYVQAITAEKALKVEDLFIVKTKDMILSIKRMAKRWEAAKGLPYELWSADVNNFLGHIKGLEAIEITDASYNVKLSESLKKYKKLSPSKKIFSDKRKKALFDAEQRGNIIATSPIELAPDYVVFICYIPIIIDGNFQGFMTGVFNVKDFFDYAVGDNRHLDYVVSVSEGDKVFYKSEINNSNGQKVIKELEVRKSLHFYDNDWNIIITPTYGFARGHVTNLPILFLIGGVLFAGLVALTARYALIAKINSIYLSESNTLNKSVLSGARHLIVVTDRQGTIMTINPAAEEKLMRASEEVVGKCTPEIWQDNEEVEARAKELSLETNEIVNPGIDVFTFSARDGVSESQDCTFVKKDGTHFPVSLTVTRLLDSKGAIKGYIWIAEDITERKEVERIKSEFISVVSHELRTPLTSIRGSLGLLSTVMAKDLPEKARQLIDIAYKNSERLILLVNDILDLDKITAGKMRFNIEEFDTASLLEVAMETNKAYADKHGVALVLEDVPNGYIINVDADRWQQVFSNLVSNAVKFSPQGAEVRVVVSKEGKMVRVAVIDKGAGIAESFYPKIFEKFSQEDSTSSRVKGGSGLGLHISREIVIRMGGEIGFISEVGKGSTFWFDFPFQRLKDGFSKENLIGNVKGGNESDVPVVLHVEQDADFSKLLSIALEGKANLIRAGSIEEARHLLHKLKFSLIIIDSFLPDGPAYELIRSVQTGIPVMALSDVEVPESYIGRLSASFIKAQKEDAKVVSTILNLIKK